MNQYILQQYKETLKRLALGVEVIDDMRRMDPVRPVRIDIERRLPHTMQEPKDPLRVAQPMGRAPSAMCCHSSGRYALTYYPGLKDHLILRLYDHDRYYIPRRLQVPLLTEAQVQTPALAHINLRVRRPVLFPGAAYNVSCTATGLRGTVSRGGQPMRWAIVEATLPDTDVLVGRTRSDDRGEFLLLLGPEAAPDSDIPRYIEARVSVAGPFEFPVPSNPDLPGQDNLWDLPLEVLPDPGLPDPVSGGVAYPAGYAVDLVSIRMVRFEVGTLLTGLSVAPFEFSLS